MEIINNEEESIKKRRGRPRKNMHEISQVLETSENRIPNWRVFNIKEIAEINPGSNQIIALKNIKTDKDGKKYIKINGRKYYEFNGLGVPRESMYFQKGNSLFIGDRFEGLTSWDGVSFRYTNCMGENISFEQRKTKYQGGVMHLKEMYKSETISASEIVAIVRHSGKIIKITKNMIEGYLNGGLNKTTKTLVESVIRINPEIFAYMEDLKNQQNIEQNGKINLIGESDSL